MPCTARLATSWKAELCDAARMLDHKRPLGGLRSRGARPSKWFYSSGIILLITHLARELLAPAGKGARYEVGQLPPKKKSGTNSNCWRRSESASLLFRKQDSLQSLAMGIKQESGQNGHTNHRWIKQAVTLRDEYMEQNDVDDNRCQD